MKKTYVFLFFCLLMTFACLNGKTTKEIRDNDIVNLEEKNVKKKYEEIWNLDIKRNGSNTFSSYNGFWRATRVDYYISDYPKNFSIYELVFNFADNYYFICTLFNGIKKEDKKYHFIVGYSVLQEEDEYFFGTENYGEGLCYIDDGIPNNYKYFFPRYSGLTTGQELVSMIEDGIPDGGIELIPFFNMKKIFPIKYAKISISEIFQKQESNETLDTLIRVDPLEGLWYIPTVQGEASEADFVNTKAILIIGKDEELNPGWYHVVIYYDSGDPERGWVCEWGAAEIAEKEIEVQLSSISEGKPYTITLKDENGRRWIETSNEAATVKGQQFIRILPLK